VVCFIVDVCDEACASSTVTFFINVLSLDVDVCPFVIAIHAFVFCVSKEVLIQALPIHVSFCSCIARQI
jgi:hypothetical protein